MPPHSAKGSGMKSRSHTVWFALFLLYFSLITVPSAHAYIDPGTGSYMFQVVIGALLAAAVAIKIWWKKIVAIVTRRRPAKAPAKAATEQEE